MKHRKDLSEEAEMPKPKKKYLLAEDNKWLCENKTQPKPTKAKQNPPELFYRDVTRK